MKLDARQLEAFFRDPDSFRNGQHIRAVTDVVGDADLRDDWDWGRFIYEWVRPSFRARIYTKGDYIQWVEVLDPKLRGRFDEGVEILWEAPQARNNY